MINVQYFVWHYIDVVENGITFLTHPVHCKASASIWDAGNANAVLHSHTFGKQVLCFVFVRQHIQSNFESAICGRSVGLCDRLQARCGHDSWGWGAS